MDLESRLIIDFCLNDLQSRKPYTYLIQDTEKKHLVDVASRVGGVAGVGANRVFVDLVETEILLIPSHFLTVLGPDYVRFG